MAKSKILKVRKECQDSVGLLTPLTIPLTSLAPLMQHERQSEKMEVEDLMEKVDAEWKSFQSLLPKAVSVGGPRLGVEGWVTVLDLQEEERGSSNPTDGYDRSVRELQFERRGQALDRMKTEEEIIREEKERLEKLEVGKY